MFFRIIILLLFIAYQATGDTLVVTARKYLWVKEKDPKGKEQIRKWLSQVGIKTDAAWCAAYVSGILTEANYSIPKIRTALAQGFLRDGYIKANDVILGKHLIKPGTLVVWRRGNTIFGHIGIVIKWNKQSGTTIEGNTSSGGTSVQAQYDGDGVYVRKRSIQPANYFRIIGFVETRQ